MYTFGNGKFIRKSDRLIKTNECEGVFKNQRVYRIIKFLNII